METTETSAQFALYNRALRLKHYPVVPNVYLFHEESDLISVTPAGYIHEYEIKLSRPDFTADFRTKRRHEFYADLEKLRQLWAGGPIKSWKRPSYFWFVVPKGLIEESDIPAYAGLIYIGDSGWSGADVIKPSPKLGKEKISGVQMETLTRSMTYRYWSMKERLLELQEDN